MWVIYLGQVNISAEHIKKTVSTKQQQATWIETPTRHLSLASIWGHSFLLFLILDFFWEINSCIQWDILWMVPNLRPEICVLYILYTQPKADFIQDFCLCNIPGVGFPYEVLCQCSENFGTGFDAQHLKQASKQTQMFLEDFRSYLQKSFFFMPEDSCYL